MSYNPNPTTKQGGINKVNVVDDSTKELLYQILQELKLSNKHLNIITDADYTTNDV